MFIAMQYIGMAIRKKPYMGVGRNLAYRKSTFFNTKGFSAHSHLMSGDDDLFVNANATAENTAVEFDPGSHTRSVPALNVQTWIKQKKRHLTTGSYYKSGDKARLFLEPASRMLFHFLLICILCMLIYWPYVIGLFILRLTLQTTVFYHVSRRFNERRLLIYSIIFDIFSPLIYGTIYVSNLLKGTKGVTWR